MTKRQDLFDNYPKKDTEWFKEILQIPPDNRRSKCLQEIARAIKEIKFFEPYLLEHEKIIELARSLRLEIFESNQTVFKQGEIGNAFYIILEGRVKVLIDIPSEVSKHFANMKEIMELKSGDSFGELALLYDTARSATVMAVEKTYCMVLDKLNFRKHLKDFHTKHVKRIINIYTNYPGFQGLTENEIAHLASRSIIQKLPSETVLIRQGDVPNQLMFILSGAVKVIRRLYYKVDPNTKEILTNDFANPSNEEISKGIFKTYLIELEELGAGEPLCMYGLYYKKSVDHTLLTSIPSEIINLAVFDIEEILPPVCLQNLKECLKNYPCDEELKVKQHLNNKWNMFKKMVAHDAKLDKLYKTNNFMSQFRKPCLKYKNPTRNYLDGFDDLDFEERRYKTRESSLENSNKFFKTGYLIQTLESLRRDQSLTVQKKNHLSNNNSINMKYSKSPKPNLETISKRNTSQNGLNIFISETPTQKLIKNKTNLNFMYPLPTNQINPRSIGKEHLNSPGSIAPLKIDFNDDSKNIFSINKSPLNSNIYNEHHHHNQENQIKVTINKKLGIINDKSRIFENDIEVMDVTQIDKKSPKFTIAKHRIKLSESKICISTPTEEMQQGLNEKQILNKLSPMNNSLGLEFIPMTTTIKEEMSTNASLQILQSKLKQNDGNNGYNGNNGDETDDLSINDKDRFGRLFTKKMAKMFTDEMKKRGQLNTNFPYLLPISK